MTDILDKKMEKLWFPKKKINENRTDFGRILS